MRCITGVTCCFCSLCGRKGALLKKRIQIQVDRPNQGGWEKKAKERKQNAGVAHEACMVE